MIKIKITPDEIKIIGHSNYDEYGKDIICASISTLIIYTLNLLDEFANDKINYIVNSGDFYLNLNNLNENQNKIIKLFKLMLEDLASQYPKNIKIN